ncbi:adenylosuccinate synthetase [Clostridia bacterium]|nr:adenylosuccinate synthetase [Clostridia bacterium]
MVKAIVGANWGDEGKGKITDICAQRADVVVRFQGGSNAGHTIINEFGKFGLHQLPSGIFQNDTTNIIANGCALNVDKLIEEIEVVRKVTDFKLLVSDRVQLVLPHHIQLDTLEEQRLADKKFGSTKSGIAPFYSDKHAKIGLQLCELLSPHFDIQEKVHMICEKLNLILRAVYKTEGYGSDELLEIIQAQAEKIRPYAADTSLFLRKAIKDGKNILLEGQLGALKDTDHGIYPYVTSSSTLAGFASVGAGIPPYEIRQIIAVTKAYSSAVGEGPFVSEIFDEAADELRKRGGDSGEFGVTTGRPRRVGWFDCVATKYGARIQGATDLALTGLDVLGYLEEIPVCIGYAIDGTMVTDFLDTFSLYRAKPVFEILEGWNSDIRDVRNFGDLPENAKRYVRFIEDNVGVKITMLSNGPKRHEMIEL